MKSNKNYLIISIIILTILNIFLVLKKDTSVIEKSKVIKVERKEFAIYKQDPVTKEYEETNDNKFPEEGYLLNETKTKCYGYNKEELSIKPIQELTNGVINGRVTIESSKTIYCEIYFDRDFGIPLVNEFEITGKTSTGVNLTNGFTYDTNVKYDISWVDNDVAQYCIGIENNLNLKCTELQEKEKADKKVTIENNTYTNNGEGTKTIYVYVKDKAGNKSNTLSSKITVDRTKPVINTFTLTGVADTNQTLSSSTDYTHKTGIKYNASITETNMEGYCIYEGSSCSYNSNTSTTLTNQSYTLANNTEGNHTVNFKVKDKAGNESAVSSKIIKLDTQNPTATIIEKTHDTESITVTVGYTGTETLIGRQCKINNQSTWKDADTNGECTINSLDDGTKLKDGTEYTIEGRVRDASGRWNTTYPNVKVTTDKKGTPASELYKNPPTGLTETDCNGMKRFVGKCDATNGGCDGIVDNFVCFGYDNVSQCANGVTDNEYIYRIIGITEAGVMKLIKNKSLSSSGVWNSNPNIDVNWNESEAFSNINGKLFLTNLSENWQKKIVEHSWPQGKISIISGAGGLCTTEQGFETVPAKVGLMVLSDFSYAWEGDWSMCPEFLPCGDSWIHLSRNGCVDPNGVEWTMVRYGDQSSPPYYSLYITVIGSHGQMKLDSSMSLRPVFYLDSTSLISSGSGTSLDPFILAP